MLAELLAINTADEFVAFTARLLNKGNQDKLREEIQASNVVLLSEDMWDDAELERVNASISAGHFPEMCASGGRSTIQKDILHRLQTLGYCNPGIRVFMDKYLEKVCL